MARGFRAGSGQKRSGSNEYVEVTGDGIKTRSQLMDALYALVDKSKLTGCSVFEIRRSTISYFWVQRVNPDYLFFSNAVTTASGSDIETINLKASGSKYTYFSDGTWGDASNSIELNGAIFRVTY